MVSSDDVASAGLGLAVIGASVWLMSKTMDMTRKATSSKAFKWF